MKKLLFIFFIPALLQAAEIIELDKKTESMNLQILKIVNELTHDGMKKKDITRGFDYRYTTKTLSSFNLDLYLVRLNEK